MAEDIPTIEVGEDETELMVLVVTTRGVHYQPFPTLGAVPTYGDQAAIVHEIAHALRKTADKLEALAGLVDAVDDVGEAMR